MPHPTRRACLAGFSRLMLLCVLVSPGAKAQQSEQQPIELEDIEVTAAGIPAKQSQLPLAAGIVNQQQIQEARQQLGLDESLRVVPGLFFQNRYNYAQDLRIAIRGFGARANFGIRGIRMNADGIPLTMPDGQSNVDSIDLGSARQIEVIRGPFSAVHGASSGGVINLETEDGHETPFLSGRINGGSHGFGQLQVKTGGQGERVNYLLNASNTRLDGYRDHAEFENTLLNSKFLIETGPTSGLTVVFNAADSPEAQDPGALNAREVAQDRSAAAPRNVLFNAGEKLDQQKLGLAWHRDEGTGRAFQLRGHYISRDFSNRLPFSVNSNGQGGSVDLDRQVGGVGGDVMFSGDLFGRSNRAMFGVDYDLQRDLRRRFANNEGVLGAKTTDQDEDVTALGLFIQDVIDLTGQTRLTLGLRYDSIDYEVFDNLGTNASGETTFDQLSPVIGLTWQADDAYHLYANVSSSFDTPTTTELANPFGPSGFNPLLDSQTATNYEAGIRSQDARSRWEIALFHISVEDEIVPFELAGAGQSFFQNAGSSTHEGIEAAWTWLISDRLAGTATYTWSDFSYDSFTGLGGANFSGNEIPGIPEHQFHLAFDYRRPSGVYAGFDLSYVGSFYANNANTVETDSYVVGNFRAGWRSGGDTWEIAPFIGINNLFDEEYMDNVRLNASFGRYFEPAPLRNYYAGIEVRRRFGN